MKLFPTRLVPESVGLSASPELLEGSPVSVVNERLVAFARKRGAIASAVDLEAALPLQSSGHWVSIASARLGEA